MNYLASPPLVVAYALAGTMDIDLTTDPLGTGSDGQPVYLRDIWPSQAEIGEVIAACRARRTCTPATTRTCSPGTSGWRPCRSRPATCSPGTGLHLRAPPAVLR